MGKIECMLQLPVFSALTSEEKLKLLSLTHQRNLEADETLFYDQEPVEAVYLIKKGRIKLSKVFEDGKEITIGFRGADEILGEEALFADYNHNTTAVAVESTFVCICTKKDCEMTVQKYPEMAMRIIKNLGYKLQQTTERVSNIASRNVRGRVKFLLSQLAREYGEKTPEGLLINFKLTHRDIAELIGASWVMVSKVLREIDEVSTHRGEILIKQTGDIFSSQAV
ncbi:MAG: Crp/Fnr family transcriptional regulator, partial [Halanaerobiales bacterium]